MHWQQLQTAQTDAPVFIRTILLLQIKCVTSQHERSSDSQIHSTICHYRRRTVFTDKEYQHFFGCIVPVACHRQDIRAMDENKNEQKLHN